MADKTPLFSDWEKRLIVLLLIASPLIYAAKLALFGDSGASNTLSYIFNSLGFLPINVLIVTLIISRLLTMRSKQEQQEKLRMVLGVFFSELGNRLLGLFAAADPASETIRKTLDVQKNWTKKDFTEAEQKLAGFCMCADPGPGDFAGMQELLHANHDFLLRLLENPLLLEQDSVSQLLQDLFHLGEELDGRDDIFHLPATDRAHLGGDVNRVYGQLAATWLSHMEYLSQYYPYLLSLSIRKSPFGTGDVVVRE
jgi:hypothetical protein